MPHKNCIDFNQADCGQLETSDCFTLTQYFWADQDTNVIIFLANVPHEKENKGQYYSHGHLVGQAWGEGGPMRYSDWVKLVLPRHLYETSGPYRLTAYTWHFPYCAAIWWAQTLALLPLNFFFFFFCKCHPLTHYWLCSEKDSGFCALLGGSICLKAPSRHVLRPP